MFNYFVGIFFSIFVIVQVQAHYDSCEENEKFQCGRRFHTNSNVITNDAVAKASDWPWFAIVLMQDPQKNNTNTYIHDGNIISRTAVLTCGHCVFSNNKMIATNRLSVQAGTSSFSASNEIGRQILPVERVVVHPGFDIDKSRATSNLAILFVNKLVFTEYVQPICIWGPIYDKTILYRKQAVVASFSSNSITMDSLQPLYSLVRSDDTCIAYVPGHASWLNEFNFCAGDILGTSPDSGRAGTGLALPETHDDNSVTWYLHGIFSHCGGDEKGNCDPKSLKLYTNVGPHYAWIYHHVFSY